MQKNDDLNIDALFDVDEDQYDPDDYPKYHGYTDEQYNGFINSTAKLRKMYKVVPKNKSEHDLLEEFLHNEGQYFSVIGVDYLYVKSLTKYYEINAYITSNIFKRCWYKLCYEIVRRLYRESKRLPAS